MSRRLQASYATWIVSSRLTRSGCRASRPSAPKASVSAARWSSGPAEVAGVVQRRVERVERRLERERRRDGADHVVERGRHRARGHEREERQRQAEHEREQRGRPHLAREAADREAERGERQRARPRARPARAGSGPSRGPRTGRARPSSARHTTTEQTAARPAFSTSRPVRDTSPRTSRENAFSSRSSASVPAASSSVMNISETATASATAKELSDVVPPSSAVGLHPDRLAHDGQHVVRERRGSRARACRTRSRGRARRARAIPRGSSVRACARICLGALEAEHVEAPGRGSCTRPPVLIRSSSWSASFGDPLRERGVGGLHLRLDRVLDVLALGRVLGVVVDLDGARLEPGLDVRREVAPG